MKRRTRQLLARLAVFSLVACAVAVAYAWLCVLTLRPLPEDPTFLALQLQQEPPPRTRLMDPKTGELSRQYFLNHDQRLYKVTIAFRDKCYGEIQLGRTDAKGRPVITSATEFHRDGTSVRYTYSADGRNIDNYTFIDQDGKPLTKTTPVSAVRRQIVWLAVDGSTPAAQATVGAEMTMELKLLAADGRTSRAEFSGTKNLDKVELLVRDAEGKPALSERSHPGDKGGTETEVVIYAHGIPQFKQVWLQRSGESQTQLKSVEEYFDGGNNVKLRIEALASDQEQLDKLDGGYRVQTLDAHGKVLTEETVNDLAAAGVSPELFAEPSDPAEKDISAKLDECFSKKRHDHIASFLAP